MKSKVTMKLVLAAIIVAYTPLGMARGKADYPTEKVTAFVVEKLDITSLPGVYRPKKEKGKRTFADYGYAAQKLDENEALVETPNGARRLSIKILQENSSGIYACVAEPAQDVGNPRLQSVILMRRKESSALLKGRESGREFASCPVFGVSNSDSTVGD
jgi:hypothetical protein